MAAVFDHKKEVPLIFVPGIMGSRLFKKDSSEPIWPPMGWWDKGHFKPRSIRELTSSTDREISLNEPLFPLVYSELMRNFENMGYILGGNFWVFPYDWTQSNRISGERLREFIKLILDTHPQWKEVDIVNHSMGGLVTRAAARLYGAPIRRTIYITSPHYGSPKAFFILHPQIEFSVFGNFFKTVIGDLAWKWYLNRILKTDNNNLEKEIKTLARQLDSVFELLPDRYYFEHKNSIVIKWTLPGEIPIQGLEATYYTAQCRFPSAETLNRIKKAMAFKDELGHSLPGKQNLVIYSDSEETYDQIVFTEHISWYFGRYRDSGQKGDQIVPTNSATLNGTVYAVKVQGTHNGVPNSTETSRLIGNFLTDGWRNV